MQSQTAFYFTTKLETSRSRAKPGTKLDVAEESAIRARGGANNKSNPNGTLENKRYQMNEERYRAAGGKVDKPN